jgi:hypothetical protein
MKAWEVQEDDDEHRGTIVFHKDGTAARRLGANELDVNPEYVTCKRRPLFDKYAEQGFVPPKVLIENHEWYFECENCFNHISESTIEDLSQVVYSGRRVFCNQACYDAREKRKQAVNNTYAEFKTECKKRFPQLTIIQFRGGWPKLTPFAYFKFPGSKYLCSIRLTQEGEYRVFIANGDLKAWEKFQGKTDIKAIERMVIGATLLNDDFLLKAMNILEPEDFTPVHRKIFTAITELFAFHQLIDLVTISDALKKDGKLEAVGGNAYLASLVDIAILPTVDLMQYVRDIHDKKAQGAS